MANFYSDSASLDVTVRDNWNGGLVADLALMPGEAIDGWTVEFEYSGAIVNIWNARIVSQTGNRYVVENLGYNGSIGAGATAGFGFSGSGASDEITALSINGEPVGGSDPVPAPLPSVSIEDAVAAEEDGGISFQVTLTEPSATDVVITYQTMAGTALAGDDFAAGSGQIVIPAGQTSAVLTIVLTDDVTLEALEQFQVQLTEATGADIAVGTATGQITDGDVAPVDPDPVDPPDDDGQDTGTYELALDDWGSGFVARFYITPGEQVSGGWTASIATTATITNVWNAEIVSHADGILTIRNASWNASIGAGETIEVGVQGNGSAGGLDLMETTLPLAGVANPMDPVDDGPVDDDMGDGGMSPVDDDTDDDGAGDGGPFVGGGQTYYVGQTSVVTNFDPTTDVLDLGPNSIHNQIPVDTPDGFMMLHMFNDGLSLLLQGVHLADLHPENFAPIADSHLQQDLSAALAWEDSTGLVRPNTVYIRSHEEGLEEIVDFDPATDKISFFYLSVRGDGERNFAVEETTEGARFYNPLSGQSMTLRGVSFADLDSSHFEWRANQLEDGIAGRMGLSGVIDGFTYPSENVFSGKSVAMAGLVDRAPYHSQPEYTGTPIGDSSDPLDPLDDGMGDDAGATPVRVTVAGGSVTEADPGMDHIHEDGTAHVHDDGHRYVTFQVTLEAPATQDVTLTYATADGSAVADTTNDVAWDYHAATGTLVFAAGDQTQTVVVAVHPDAIVEDTETFTLSVADENITGILEATGTIYDNDIEGPTDDGRDDDLGDDGMDDMPDDHGDHDHGMFIDITEYGTFHGSSGHTDHGDLEGGRTPITTEAMLAYNGLRNFLGLGDVTQEEIATWAFSNGITNNTQAYGQDLLGVGLWYGMQGAKVGWINDDAFAPQILADIQREARLGDPDAAMDMVEAYGHDGFAAYLTTNGLDGHFIETLKMEPHYGGWMHGRTHGYMNFPEGGAIAHDVNHLTVLSHDQTQPFMNDTFDWPQWPALNVPHRDVIDYFQSVVVLGDPLGDAIPTNAAPTPVDLVDPADPIDPPGPVEPDPVVTDPVVTGDGSNSLDAYLSIANDWGNGAVIELEITNTDQFQFTGGWQVQFEFDTASITGSWNSTWSASSMGDSIIVSDVGWNGNFSAGQTLSVGFQVDYGDLNEELLNQEAEFLFL